MPNIFLMGKAGSGKTTVAKMICGDHYFSLATELKNEMARFMGREPTKADRALMIEFGQTTRRWFGSDIWIRRLINNPAFQTAQWAEAAVIDDGRHLLEYMHFALAFRFASVRIISPDEVRFQRLINRDGVDQREALEGKEEELSIIPVTYEIVNDGSLDDLEDKVNAMMYDFASHGW